LVKRSLVLSSARRHLGQPQAPQYSFLSLVTRWPHSFLRQMVRRRAARRGRKETAGSSPAARWVGGPSPAARCDRRQPPGPSIQPAVRFLATHSLLLDRSAARVRNRFGGFGLRISRWPSWEPWHARMGYFSMPAVRQLRIRANRWYQRYDYLRARYVRGLGFVELRRLGSTKVLVETVNAAWQGPGMETLRNTWGLVPPRGSVNSCVNCLGASCRSSSSRHLRLLL